MTNTERNLEVSKECGASLTNGGRITIFTHSQLDAYTSRICAEKDAEIRVLEACYQEALSRIVAANAAIAMKDEALVTIINEYRSKGYFAGADALAQFLSPESIAAWEAEKLLPLQRQVAMMYEYIDKFIEHCNAQERGWYSDGVCSLISARAFTQATAEAFMNEHAAKVLEEAVSSLRSLEGNACNSGFASCFDAANVLADIAAELRAANKKENE